MKAKRSRLGSRTQGVNADEKPVEIKRLTDAERKIIEADEVLEFPDNINIYAQTEDPPTSRRYFKLDTKSLKAICAEWKASQS